jgi:hypothetical protein
VTGKKQLQYTPLTKNEQRIHNLGAILFRKNILFWWGLSGSRCGGSLEHSAESACRILRLNFLPNPL